MKDDMTCKAIIKGGLLRSVLLLLVMTGGTALAQTQGVRVNGSVFGGGNEANVETDSKVTISGGTITHNVHGGGNLADVERNVTVNIIGGTIGQDVYGGGALAKVNTDRSNGIPTTTVNLLGGTIGHDAYGGGLGQREVKNGNNEITTAGVEADAGNTKVNLNGMEADDYVSEEYAAWNILQSVDGRYLVKTDTKGCVVNRIFGANNANGSPKGDVTVHVFATQHRDELKPTISSKFDTPYIAVDQTEDETDKQYLGRLVEAASGVTGVDATTLSDAQTVWDDVKNIEEANLTTAQATSITTAANALASALSTTLSAMYDVQAVYGGGNEAAYNPTTPYTETNTNGSKSHVIIEGCDYTSIQYVYGGGNAAPVPSTEVEIRGSKIIDYVFGGGNGKDATSYGANPGADVGILNKTLYDADHTTGIYGTGIATTKLFAGNINTVYGGSNTKGNVRGGTNVSMPERPNNAQHGTGKEYCDDILIRNLYGAGQQADQDGGVTLVLGCIHEMDYVYGGAKDAHIKGGVNLTITSGKFKKIFGGNDQRGTIQGPIKLNIEETGCAPIEIEELYLGGNMAPYSVYGYWRDSNGVLQPRTSATDTSHPVATGTSAPDSETGQYLDPVLNVISCTSIGSVFGGGYGDPADMYGNPTVNINMVKGNQAGETYNYTEIPDRLGTINNVFGGGNEADVYGSPTVNIGTAETVDMTSVEDIESTTSINEGQPNVEGARIVGNVYGGGKDAVVHGSTIVEIGTEAYDSTVEGVQILRDDTNQDESTGNVFGGGKGEGATVEINTNVTVSGGSIANNVYGGGMLGSVGTETHTIHNTKNPDTPNSHAPGAIFNYGLSWPYEFTYETYKDENDEDQYTGTANVTINGTAKIGGDVYGAGKGEDNGEEGTGTDDKYNYRYKEALIANVRETIVNIEYDETPSTATPENANIAGSVYGGGENGHVYKQTDVTITKGLIGGSVFGGGKGEGTFTGTLMLPDQNSTPSNPSYTETSNVQGINNWLAGKVYGNTNVTIDGGHVMHNVYGGGYFASVGIGNYAGGSDDFFPAGYGELGEQGEAIDGNHKGGPIWDADSPFMTSGIAKVTIKSGIIGTPAGEEDNITHFPYGNVFGGSRGKAAQSSNNSPRYKYAPIFFLGYVNETEVIIGDEGSNNLTIYGSVYGGGQDGHVRRDTKVTVNKGEIGLAYTDANKQLLGTSDTQDTEWVARGNVFGAGSGLGQYNQGTAQNPNMVYNFSSGSVTCSTNVEIKGGTIHQSVYGGGALASIGPPKMGNFEQATVTSSSTHKSASSTHIIINGGTIGDLASVRDAHYGGNVFGASRGDITQDLSRFATTIWSSVDVKEGTVYGSVFGGGEIGIVHQDTEVTIEDGAIGIESVEHGGAFIGNVYGGGKGSTDNVDAGLVKGNTYVNVSDGNIYHNVYGGGAYGSVGTITRGNVNWVPGETSVSDMPSEWEKEEENTTKKNTGTANITITGGTIGINGNENGMVFGSSRGDVGAPASIHDKLAWVYDTNVTIGETSGSTSTPLIKGSVYGSGENGHTYHDTDVQIHSGTIGIASGAVITSNGVQYDGAAYPYRGNVFGGGCGTDKYYEDPGEETHDGNGQLYNALAGIVHGDATVTIDGGMVVRNVFGAGAMGSVNGTTKVNIAGDAVIGVDGNDNGYVYAAARGEEGVSTLSSGIAQVQETILNISGGTINGSAFGGGQSGIVKGSVAVTMTGGTVVNDVYGGGALADTNTDNWNGNTFVQVPVSSGISLVTGLYTAENDNALITTPNTLAGDQTYYQKGDWNSGMIEGGKTKYKTTVRLLGGIVGNAYGGGLGRMEVIGSPAVEAVTGIAAMVYGDVTVTVSGTAFTHSFETPKDANGVAIPDALDVPTNGRVFGCNNLNGTPKGDVLVEVYRTRRITETGVVSDDHQENVFEIHSVYGGGNLAVYQPASGKATKVIIDGCNDTSIEKVFGGGNSASVPSTDVLILGTFYVGYAFSGGNGADMFKKGNTWYENDGAPVYGDATIIAIGGKIGQIFGGSDTKGTVYGTTTTKLKGRQGEGEQTAWQGEGYVSDCPLRITNAYGAARGADINGDVNFIISGCQTNDEIERVFGGSYDANIRGSVTLTITGGIFAQVFGGNDHGGSIGGEINVNIEETQPDCNPIIIQYLYGGGREADYPGENAKYITNQKDQNGNYIGTITYEAFPNASAEKNAKITVNVKSATRIDNIYGGSYRATMNGDTEVNINMMKGNWVNHLIDLPDTYRGDQIPNVNNPTVRYEDVTSTLIAKNEALGISGSSVTGLYIEETGDEQVVYTKIVDQNARYTGGDTHYYQLHMTGTVKDDIGTIGNVYGGGYEGSVNGNARINIGTETKVSILKRNESGVIVDNNNEPIYDNNGKLIPGKTVVYDSTNDVRGANITGHVYGGGENANVTGNTYVYVGTKDGSTPVPEGASGVTIAGNVFGGGKGIADSFYCDKAMVGVNNDNTGTENAAHVNDGTHIIIGNGQIGSLDENGKLIAGTGNVYGGGEIARVEYNTAVTIGLEHETITSAPDIKGNVFGAGKGLSSHGYSALVRGNSTVIVQGNAKVGQSVYGGGEIASVGKYEVVNGMPQALVSQNLGKCYVTVQGNAEIGPDDMKMPTFMGNVFGAGKGALPYEGYEDTEHPLQVLPTGPVYYATKAEVGDDGDESNYLKFIESLALATETHVTVGGNAFVKGSVYGGSENGHVQHDTSVTIGGTCQIGAGFNKSTKKSLPKYTEAQFINPTTIPVTDGNSLAECASWNYDNSSGAPYDKFATHESNGKYYYDAAYTKYAEGGRPIAEDGHTFYGNVFGGGSGKEPYTPGKWHFEAGSVGGNTTVTINGGHILTSVYGGNEMTNVTGRCTVTMSGGTLGVPRTLEQIEAHPVTCYLFGSGKGDQRIFFNTQTNVNEVEMTITGGTIYGSVFGGGEDGHVLEDIQLTIGDKTNGTGPIIGTTGTSYVDGNVFGGGRGFSGEALTPGTVGGNIDLKIYGGTMLGSVYGGGRLASVGTYFTDPNNPLYGQFQEDETTGTNKTYGHITIDISGGTIGNDVEGAAYGGNVFGGSMGRLTLLDGTTMNPRWPELAQAKTTTINISGNTTTIKRNVYGGGEFGSVREDAHVTISGGTINGSVYGGGYGSDDFEHPTPVHVYWGEGQLDFVYTPMQWAGCVGGDTYVNISGGHVKQNVYGGGERASVGLISYQAETVSSETSDNKSDVIVSYTDGQNVTTHYKYLNIVKHADITNQGKTTEEVKGFGLSWPYEFTYVPCTPTGTTPGGKTNVSITGGRIGTGTIGTKTDTSSGYVYGGGKGQVAFTGISDIHEQRYIEGFCANARETEVTINYTNFTSGTTDDGSMGCITGAVYGGGEDGHIYADANVNIVNGLIGYSVYGGGKGISTYKSKLRSRTAPYDLEETLVDFHSWTAGKVYGNTTVTMSGGHVWRNVIGGGYYASVGKGNYAGGTDDYYHAGYGETLTGNLWDNESDDSKAFLSSGKCTVTITGGTVGTQTGTYDGFATGQVYGGSRGTAAEDVGALSPRYAYAPTFFLGYANETEVTIGDATKQNGPTIFGSVYGGGRDGHVRRHTSVTINKGEIGYAYNADDAYSRDRGNVYGSGSGMGTWDGTRHGTSSGSVTRNTTVIVNGGTIHQNVYGGGAMSSVGPPKIGPIPIAGKEWSVSTVEINGGQIGVQEDYTNHQYGGNVFGASRGGDFVSGVETADNYATTLWTQVNTYGGNIIGDVYGGGQEGNTKCSVEVNILGGTIGHDVYGGGALANTNTGNWNLSAEPNTIGWADQEQQSAKYTTHVNILGGKIVGDAYGGGLGRIGQGTEGQEGYIPSVMAIVYGDVKVNLNGLEPDDYEKSVHSDYVHAVGPEEVGEGENPSRIEYYALKTTTTGEGTSQTTVYPQGAIVSRVFGANNLHGTPLGHVKVHVFATQNADVENYPTISNKKSSGQSGLRFTTKQQELAFWITDILDIENSTNEQIATKYSGTGYGYDNSIIQIIQTAKSIYENPLPGENIENQTLTPEQEKTIARNYRDQVDLLTKNLNKEALRYWIQTGTGNVDNAIINAAQTALDKYNAADEVTKEKAKTQIANIKGSMRKPSYDVLAVYGGGNQAAYDPVDAYSTNTVELNNARSEVYIDGCDFTSIYEVYGGSNAASVPASFVSVNAAYEIEEVFGGGNGKDNVTVNGELRQNPGAHVGYFDFTEYTDDTDANGAKIAQYKIPYRDYYENDQSYLGKDARLQENSLHYGSGIATTTITGGYIHSVYGGSNTKGIIREAAESAYDQINDDCPLHVDDTYGAGKDAEIDGEIHIDMACAAGIEVIYGGANNSDVNSDITLNITNGSSLQRVFGGNNTSGLVNGSITVNVKEYGCEPIIISDGLYAGGYLADYSIYGYDNEGHPRTKAWYDALSQTEKDNLARQGIPYKDPRINIISATYIANVFGGGYQAKVIGSPHVNVNMEQGKIANKYLGAYYGEGVQNYDAYGLPLCTIVGYDKNAEGLDDGIIELGYIKNIYGGGNEADVTGDTHVEIGTGTWHTADGDLQMEGTTATITTPTLFTYDKTQEKWTYVTATNTQTIAINGTPVPVQGVTIPSEPKEGDQVRGTYTEGNVDINRPTTFTYHDNQWTYEETTYSTEAIADTPTPTRYQAQITGNVYGGGKGIADTFTCEKAMVGVDGEGLTNSEGGTEVIIANGQIGSLDENGKLIAGTGNVYGGGEIGRVEKNTVVTIGLESGPGEPIIYGNVFGGGMGAETHGYAGLVRGNPTITIQGEAKVRGSVYGGGEIATVGNYFVKGVNYPAALNAPEPPADLPNGMPYALKNESGKSTVIVRGNAEIGPDDMAMTKPGGPDDSGHIFGAGKGLLPKAFSYTDDDHKPKRMVGSNGSNEWEYFANETDYITFVETQAMTANTDVMVGGNAFIKGSVYGGSENGHVLQDTKVTIQDSCQIGNGYVQMADDGTRLANPIAMNRRYTDAEWENGRLIMGESDSDELKALVNGNGGNSYYTTSLPECASWPYGKNISTDADTIIMRYLPYDIYDLDADSVPKHASDGHTFYGNVFGGGSGYFPYRKNADWTKDNAKSANAGQPVDAKGYSDGVWLRSAGAVYGNTEVIITGGHILTSVYGGNEMTDVGKFDLDENGAPTLPKSGIASSTVKMSGGTLGVPRTLGQIAAHPVTCYLFGAGKGDQRINFDTWTNVNTATVEITDDARIYGSVFGGGEDGHVLGDVNLTIGNENNGTGDENNGTGENAVTTRYPYIGTTGTSYVDGNIFGAGRGFSGDALTAGSVGGNVTVNIKDGTILGSIYGGGRLASVGTFFTAPTDPSYGQLRDDVLYTESDDIPTGKQVGDIKDSYGHITINISGGTIGNDAEDITVAHTKGGNVFGGSMGRLTLLDGSINNLWPKMAVVKTSTINISGNALIKSNVYGGGEYGMVRGDARVTIGGTWDKTNNVITPSEGEGKPTIKRDVFGGGYGSDDYKTKTTISASYYSQDKYTFTPMQFAGIVCGDTYIDILKGNIEKNLYGGGEMATVGLIDFTTAVASGKHEDIVNEGKSAEKIYGFGLSWPYQMGFIPHDPKNTNVIGGTTHVNITGGRLGITGKDYLGPFNANGEAISATDGHLLSKDEQKAARMDNGDVFGGGKGIAGDRYDYAFCANVKATEVTINYPSGNEARPSNYKNKENDVYTYDCITGSVYAGAENGHVIEDTKVTLKNGLVGHAIYGGGKGKDTYTVKLQKIGTPAESTLETNPGNYYDADITSITAGKVYGNTQVVMEGGYVVRNIYGGGNMASVGKGNYAGGPDDYSITGYGELPPRTNNVEESLWTNTDFLNSGKTEVIVKGGTVGYIKAGEPDDSMKDGLPYGNIFGGCRGESAPNIGETPRYHYAPKFFSGYVNETKVIVGEKNTAGPSILGTIYGGGQDGHVRRDTYVAVNSGEIGIPYSAENRTLVGTDDLDNAHWLHRGNVYGAGSGIGQYQYDFTYDGDYEDTVAYTNPVNNRTSTMKETDYSTSAGSVTRYTQVDINGGIIHRNVYGGGSLSSVGAPKIPVNGVMPPDPYRKGDTAAGHGEAKQSLNLVNIASTIGTHKDYQEKYGGEVYGASRGQLDTDATQFATSIWTEVNLLPGARVQNNVFGGGDNGMVKQDADVNVGVTLSPQRSINVASGEGSQASITVTPENTSDTWTASSKADWLTITTASGTGNGTITATATANTGTTTRTATITLSSERKSQLIQVTQAAAESTTTTEP